MRKISYAVIFALVAFTWIAMADAEPNSSAATYKEAIQPGTSIDGNNITPPTAGIPWKEKVMMWREIKKRGQSSRNALMAEAEKKRKAKPPKPDKVKSPLDL